MIRIVKGKIKISLEKGINIVPPPYKSLGFRSKRYEGDTRLAKKVAEADEGRE